MADKTESYFKDITQKTEPIRQSLNRAPALPKKAEPPKAPAAPKVVAYTEYQDEDNEYMRGSLARINKRLASSRSIPRLPKRSSGR